jgi:endonuclease/exonuclease/phosphatase (EEP) superfamily protein YafD
MDLARAPLAADSPRSVAPPLVRARRLCVQLAACGTICAALATLAAPAARELWVAELTVHFRVQYVMFAALALPCLLWARRFALAALALSVLAGNLWIIWPLFAAPTARAPAAAALAHGAARVASANVFFLSGQYARVREWIEHERPDIIVLLEITPQWRAALATLARSYPYQSFADDNGSGVWLLSRWPLSAAGALEFGPRAAPAVFASARIGTQTLQLIGVHLTWPFGTALSSARNASFRQLATFSRTHPQPLLIIGDLNCSPFSPYFGDLLRDGDLMPAATGWQPTWPTFMPPLGIAIDHALLAHGVAVRAFHRGAWIGSDHLPIVVDLAL